MGAEFDRATRGSIVNEARELGIDGFFTCGNVLQVHDLVDYVTEEGEIAGRAVTKYLSGASVKRTQPIKLILDENVSYIVPHQIDYLEKDRKRIKLFMRVWKPAENVRVKLVKDNGEVLASYKKEEETLHG
ncbi:MAG: hypothetical protein KAX49_20105 [Halanaerobiales bacterium]|nr:hypothetical protein [Halanaerobiales bacterium]